MSVALGTQTVADLSEAGPATRERVAATIESIVCHRIGSAEDADWISQLIGNIPAWHTTTRTDGLGLTNDEGTRSRGYRYEVHPAQLQRLNSGEAFVARLDAANGGAGPERAGGAGLAAGLRRWRGRARWMIRDIHPRRR